MTEGRLRLFAPEQSESSPGFDANAFDALAGIEADSFWFRARNDLIAWAAAKYFGASLRAHEIGCGTGFVIGALQRALPDAALSGSEVLVDGLRYAAARYPEVELMQIDARGIPFRDEFDLIGAFDVLEHIEDDRAVLSEIRAALVNGGGLLLTVPQHPRLWSVQDELAHHRRRYTRRGLQAKLQEAGFEVVRSTSFVSLLLPALVIERRLGRQRSSNRDAVGALTQPMIVDRGFRAWMSVERRLIQAGASFPVGGSLMVAARRAR